MMRAMLPRDRRRVWPAVFFVYSAILGAAAPALAVDPVVGIRSLAMGGSLRALAEGDEGTLLNPSGIAVLRQFAAGGSYSFRAQTGGHFLHASVSDSVTQKYLALGLYNTFFYETPSYAYRLAEGGTSSRVVT